MLSSVLLLLFLVFSNCSELHDKVFRNLLRLCPEQYVPTDNSTAVNYSTETASCCTDYFDQSQERMFYSNTSTYLEAGQICLYPTTHQHISYYRTMRPYYMIKNPPGDGCIISDNSTEEINNDYNQPTCSDSEVISFRRFHPVYSKQSGFIYKNPHCAYCHGQYELTEWTTYASCDLLAPFEYDLRNCQFKFVYPGLVNEIKHLECFTDEFNSCPDQFADNVNIPSTVDLSVDELAEACSMDHLPRFEHKSFWKNVFCYICHDCSFTICPFTKCLKHDSSERVIGNFIRILDWRLIEQTMHIRNQDEQICGLDTNVKVCHEVMCPQGQVMTEDEEGMKCKMDSTRWVAENTRFVMWLLLDFGHSIAINEDALEEVFTRDQFQNPWHSSWTIFTFYRPFARNIDMAYAHGQDNNMSKVQLFDSFSHAYVEMSCKQNTVNPAKFVKRIEQTLPKKWSFKIANKIYRARQSFSKSKFVVTDKVSIEQGDSLRYGVPSWHFALDINPHERVLYKAVVKTTLPRLTADITRLMFCKQVELPSTEFDVFLFDRHPVTLYYNRTGKFLYDNEFTTRSKTTDERIYRICISDIERKTDSNNCGKRTNTYELFVVVFVILFI